MTGRTTLFLSFPFFFSGGWGLCFQMGAHLACGVFKRRPNKKNQTLRAPAQAQSLGGGAAASGVGACQMFYMGVLCMLILVVHFDLSFFCGVFSVISLCACASEYMYAYVYKCLYACMHVFMFACVVSMYVHVLLQNMQVCVTLFCVVFVVFC